MPIAARSDEIIKLIREHQVIVLAGGTGSGKTTQLPKPSLAAGRGTAGLIRCTQPRRTDSRSGAIRVADGVAHTAGTSPRQPSTSDYAFGRKLEGGMVCDLRRGGRTIVASGSRAVAGEGGGRAGEA